jgi:hypothetical protein
MLYGGETYGSSPYGDFTSLVERIFFFELALNVSTKISVEPQLEVSTSLDLSGASKYEAEFILRALLSIPTIFFITQNQFLFTPKENQAEFLAERKNNLFDSESKQPFSMFHSLYKKNVFISVID